MLYKQLIELFDILDSPKASGAQVVEYLNSIMPGCKAETYPLEGPKGHTDMVRTAELPARSVFWDVWAVWERVRSSSDSYRTGTARLRLWLWLPSFLTCRKRAISWKETYLFPRMYARMPRRRRTIRFPL